MTTADRPPLAEGIPDRLYGRRRSHPLRPRQQRLLDETLPRLRLAPAAAGEPRAAFAIPVEALWLEVGFGGGEHALAHVGANPGIGYIAAEVFENGLCSLLSRLVVEGEEASGPLPPNLRLWPQDARHLLGLLPAASLDRLFLLFPDPWPKARHAKRRFVNPGLLPLVARAIRPGGEWRIASDDPTYQAWTAEVLAAQDLFEAPPPARTRPEGWPPTRYEAKALREGRQPLYWSLRRRDG
ncbi:tRNA (guanine(46)-N(7))-methyltransferase TrmB [Roseicella frigidaeris]|uniref:tRNA (guanine-N(7)-)-methyltransferase n=1 Tax=Roseicella frigidaeris TaxID=2230885 RepID=A0A327M5B3_9PROT|nr:tRNA (guanine(46)-N(7))-methyltransferase TrmB [Roseicella frigidaeris]RAI57615.1 tRNA (guanosine(46)-N7)-methyltransferase TrmB [Roseicella frigidaeris]